MSLRPETQARAEAMLDEQIVGWEERSAGLTHSLAGIATVSHGRRVFVKAATETHSSAEVARELRALQQIQASFMAELLAWDAADPPMLALEDLSDGHWPEPYPEDLSRLEAALEELRTTPVPEVLGLDVVESSDPQRWAGLAERAAAGTPRIARWVAEFEETLLALAAGADTGNALVHGDLWYSNICFLPDRVVFVDWSHAFVGSPWHDAATVSIDLVIEGRRPIAPHGGAAWAAAYLAGSIGALAKGPSDSIGDPVAWRTDVEELVDGAAWWIAHELGLPMPPLLSARRVGFL